MVYEGAFIPFECQSRSLDTFGYFGPIMGAGIPSRPLCPRIRGGLIWPHLMERAQL